MNVTRPRVVLSRADMAQLRDLFHRPILWSNGNYGFEGKAADLAQFMVNLAMVTNNDYHEMLLLASGVIEVPTADGRMYLLPGLEVY